MPSYGGFDTTIHTGSSGDSHGGIVRSFSDPSSTPSGTSVSENGGNSTSGLSNWMSQMMDSINSSAFDQWQFNSEEAAKNRKWMEKMSNTAHQREVQDLIKAGLNPVLSAMNGNGASTPQGQAAQGASAASAISSIMSSYINAQSAIQVASIYTANQRYMAENYPSNIIQGLNALFSSGDGSGSGISNMKKAFLSLKDMDWNSYMKNKPSYKLGEQIERWLEKNT